MGDHIPAIHVNYMLSRISILEDKRKDSLRESLNLDKFLIFQARRR